MSLCRIERGSLMALVARIGIAGVPCRTLIAIHDVNAPRERAMM